MEKKIKVIKAFGLLFLPVLLGVYILKNSDTNQYPLLGKTIGIVNIIFFGSLILWGVFKLVKNSSVK